MVFFERKVVVFMILRGEQRFVKLRGYDPFSNMDEEQMCNCLFVRSHLWGFTSFVRLILSLR